jgi:hypothetical protein
VKAIWKKRAIERRNSAKQFRIDQKENFIFFHFIYDFFSSIKANKSLSCLLALFGRKKNATAQ